MFAHGSQRMMACVETSLARSTIYTSPVRVAVGFHILRSARTLARTAFILSIHSMVRCQYKHNSCSSLSSYITTFTPRPHSLLFLMPLIRKTSRSYSFSFSAYCFLIIRTITFLSSSPSLIFIGACPCSHSL